MVLQQSIFMIAQQQQLESMNELVPKQLHFGQQIVTVLKSHRTVSGFQTIISTIPFTSSSQSEKKLSEKLMRECYWLQVELKNKEYTREECLLYSLKRMGSCVVEEADKNGMLLSHKLLYLSLKYLALLVCKQKAAKIIVRQDKISLNQWLADVHSLFFQASLLQEHDHNSILEYLRNRDYHSLLECIQSLQKQQEDDYKNKLMELITKITLVKIDQAEKQLTQNPELHRITATTPFLLQQYKNKYNSLARTYKKPASLKPHSKEVLDLTCEALLGTHQSIKHLVRSSWPLYLVLLSPHGQLNYKEAVKQMLPKDNSSEQFLAFEFLLNLMGSAPLHAIYQSSFSLLPPLQCHLLAYLFHFYNQPSPLPTLIQQDYINDIARCLLEQASNNGSSCFFYSAAYLQSNEIIQRKAEMLQPLLYHHLSVIDSNDQEEIQQFLQRVKLMAKLGLQRYAQSHFDTLFFSLMSDKKLDSQLIQCFTLIASLYGRNFAYDEQMAAYLQQYLHSNAPQLNAFQEIESLGHKLRSKKIYKKQLVEYTKLQPYFEKMRTINIARTDPNFWVRVDVATGLIQSSGQSIPLLQILLGLSQELALQGDGYSEEEVWRKQMFGSEVCRYIDHYPQGRSSRQRELIDSLHVIYQ